MTLRRSIPVFVIYALAIDSAMRRERFQEMDLGGICTRKNGSCVLVSRRRRYGDPRRDPDHDSHVGRFRDQERGDCRAVGVAVNTVRRYLRQPIAAGVQRRPAPRRLSEQHRREARDYTKDSQEGPEVAAARLINRPRIRTASPRCSPTTVASGLPPSRSHRGVRRIRARQVNLKRFSPRSAQEAKHKEDGLARSVSYRIRLIYRTNPPPVPFPDLNWPTVPTKVPRI
jgi:hypothetical protein